MPRPAGSENQPVQYETSMYEGKCKHCFQAYQEGDNIIGYSRKQSLDFKSKYYHFNCFEGRYKRYENERPIYMVKTRNGQAELYVPATNGYESRDYVAGYSAIDSAFQSLFQSLSSDVTETHAEGFEIPEPQPAPELQPEPETTNPSSPEGVIAGLTSLMMQPLEKRLGQLESSVHGTLKSAVNALKDQTGKLDESKVLELINTHAVHRIEVTVTSPEDRVTVNLGVQHEKFEQLLKTVSARLFDGTHPNAWIVGPAGTGKTKAAENVAKALGVKFYFTGALAEPYSLLGFKNARGKYQRTPFRDAYEHGGLFLWDEVDSSENVALMPFNAALANGHCAFPDGIIARHPDNICMASANTWGHGAKDAYVGRLKLDGAFLDRFVQIAWDVDEKLERALAGNDAWVNRVQHVRRNVAAKGIKVLVTPRASINGAALLAAGIPQLQVEAMVLRKGMTEDQWQGVK